MVWLLNPHLIAWTWGPGQRCLCEQQGGRLQTAPRELAHTHLPAYPVSLWHRVNTGCLLQGPCNKPELPQIPAPSSGAPPRASTGPVLDRNKHQGYEQGGRGTGSRQGLAAALSSPASWRAGTWPVAHTGRQYLLTWQACLSFLTPVPWQKLSKLALAGVADQRSRVPDQPLGGKAHRPPGSVPGQIPRALHPPPTRAQRPPSWHLITQVPRPFQALPATSLWHISHAQCLTLSQQHT